MRVFGLTESVVSVRWINCFYFYIYPSYTNMARCGFLWLVIYPDERLESNLGQEWFHIPLIAIQPFKPHLEDLTLPLPCSHMSQPYPRRFVCCRSWSAVSQSFISKATHLDCHAQATESFGCFYWNSRL